MPRDAQSALSERRYRCSECHRDDGLEAVSYGYMIGKISPDGRSLDDYSGAIEDTDLCEETIECPDHVGAVIEKLIAGVWCRWEPCTAEGCQRGRVKRWGSEYDCSDCKGRGGQEVEVDALHA